jgi:hypothetical protein
MNRGPKLVGGGFHYTAAAYGPRDASAYTPRVTPYHPSASVPLEAQEILWQK